jgi:hypothetical protein
LAPLPSQPLLSLKIIRFASGAIFKADLSVKISGAQPAQLAESKIEILSSARNLLPPNNCH